MSMNKTKVVVVTGSSEGMGKEIAYRFLEKGHIVIGLDIKPPTIFEPRFVHYTCDVADKSTLPELPGVEVGILINNAGVQNSGRDIDVNLRGVINCTEKYGLQPAIEAIVNQASVSAHNGAEFPEYVASKGGVLSYTVWTAKEVAKYGATCNSLSFGGVLTDLNKNIIDDTECWNEIMSMTPLAKWATASEAADWVYFVAAVNRSMTGQDIIIDNGETRNHKFVWQ